MLPTSAATLLFASSLVSSVVRADVLPPGFYPLPSVAKNYTTIVSGISGDGRVAVGRAAVQPAGSAGDVAAVWHDLTATAVSPVSLYWANAQAANYDGSIAVGGFSRSQSYAVKYVNGQVVDLADWTEASGATAISGDGTVIVGAGTNEGFRLSSSGFQLLGRLPGHGRSLATGVSDNGRVIGGLSAKDWGTESPGNAVRWIDGVMSVLPAPPGFAQRSQVNDVSPDGEALVGWSRSTSLTRHPTAWFAGAAVDLGVLPVGAGQVGTGEALGVSRDGSAVVGQSGYKPDSSPTQISGARALLWTPTLGMVDLNQYLVHGFGANLNGWRLTDARGISDDGTVIVGNAVDAQNQLRSWVAVVPAPSSFVLILGCGLFLNRRTRSR